MDGDPWPRPPILVLSVLYLSRGRHRRHDGSRRRAPRGLADTGGLYRLPGAFLKQGLIAQKELIRTGPGAHAGCASPTDRWGCQRADELFSHRRLGAAGD